MSTTMTLDDLRRILAECVGVEDDSDLAGDILDVTFEDLGYDSLALLETTAAVGREFRVEIPEERSEEMQTPRGMIDLVNSLDKVAA
ncbi:acyl carrier protein [Streptomyces sp. NPDC058613]|uniref:acyl carrier protein n=1 Tax=unclassified Streptomyces TaxID=2593676 RepID=UPI00365967D2